MARFLMPIISVTLGTVVAGSGIALDWYQLPGRRDILYSDLFTGAVAGGLSYLALWYQRSHQRIVLARIRIIAEMNHHIRNAMTPLLFSAHLARHRELLELTKEAAERIDWALREVLPADDPAIDRRARPLNERPGPSDDKPEATDAA
jgi:hypothetical protein